MRIEKTQISYLQKRKRDDVGEIFEWQGKILRGIFPQTEEMVREFFTSGFVDELVKKDLFPPSRISEYTCEGYGMIVEHQCIWPVIYPQEWTFSMLQDSALAVLNVAMIARRYGYNMKDCHGFNILFEHNKPKFIDLGSFHRNKPGCTGWEPFTEFMRFYYYPLFYWKDGMEYFSKLSIFSANLTPHAEFFVYCHRWMRWLKRPLMEKLIKLRFLPADIACVGNETLQRKLTGKPRPVAAAFMAVKKLIDIMPFTASQNLARWQRKIRAMKRRETATMWKNYHNDISRKKERFESIIKYVNELCPDAQTAIDIAGNQGAFSLIVLKETGIRQVICQDLDEQAADAGYRMNRGVEENISFVNYNAIAPIVKTTHPLPSERFQADLVFTLALLHHLILTQGFSLEDILGEIGRYTRKYICMEFMPKGLWTYGSEVKVPEWYTVDWFREEFTKHFDIMKEEQIADNYIVFIGKKRGM